MLVYPKVAKAVVDLKFFLFALSLLPLPVLSCGHFERRGGITLRDWHGFGSLSDVSLRNCYGGKARNLYLLSSLKDVNVPVWSAISCDVFKQLINQFFSKDVSYLRKLMASGDIAGAFECADALRRSIQNLKMPGSLSDSVLVIYNNVSKFGQYPVAVRSSSSVEDGFNSSFAGLYDSVLNLRTFDDFLAALKSVYASNFSNRAIRYYIEKSIDVLDSSMGIVVQDSINAIASGTAFSVDVSTGYDGVSIMSNFGVEGGVNGASTDSFLFTSDLFPLKMSVCDKDFFHQSDPHNSGTMKVDMKSRRASIDLSTAEAIAQILKSIQAQLKFNKALDAEFCIGSDNVIYFVQVRPIVDVFGRDVLDISENDVKNVIAEGQYSVGGVSHGRIKIIDNFEKLESGKFRIEEQDIVVTNRIENQWSQFFANFRGIVSTEGNPMAHPMLIAREHGVPCVIGVRNAVDALAPYDGQLVTIDGFRKKIYLGTVPLVMTPICKVCDLFRIVKPEALPNMSDFVSEGIIKKKMIRDEYGDVWFVKPDSVLSGVLLQLHLESFALRNDLIRSTGADFAKKFDGVQKVIGGKIYEKLLGSLEEQVGWFQDLTYNNYEKYYQQESEAYRRYIESCEKLDISSIESWNAFCDSYRKVCAYMWLSFTMRISVLQRAYKLGHELSVPEVYLHELEERVQSASFQEDVNFQRDIENLLVDFCKYYKQSNIADIDIASLRSEHPDLYQAVSAISRKYKFSHCVDWKTPVSLKSVLKRIGQFSADVQYLASDFGEIYFPNAPGLVAWVTLGTKSKIHQNNAHHLIVRGQWVVRDKLLSLAQRVIGMGKRDYESLTLDGARVNRSLVKDVDILEASVEQIASFIRLLS